MIGNPLNNPQETIQEKIREVIQFEKETLPQITRFLKTIEPFLEEITKTESPIAVSYLTLHTIFQKLRSFEKDILAISKPTIDSFADEIIKRGLNKEFLNLNMNMPTAPDLQKFMGLKSQANFAQAVTALKMDFVYWFHLPFIVAAKWERFWIFILSMIPSEDPARGVYQQCRNEFKAVDHEQMFRRAAETSKKQLELLKQYGKNANIDFNESLKLRICVKGSIVTGSIQSPVNVPAHLFLFEDRIAILNVNEKSVKQQSNLSVWLVQSTVFPKSQMVIDVLGIDFSFAFQPENSVDFEALKHNWEILRSQKPKDYSIYQPIRLNSSEPDALEWVEINE
ncbi:hypothetical protein TRFO_32841 [Tritrichomonas foetus]|uniref:Uncharacterized protein n=1 Tax=Tritrichomonas foetus TaxID=1144522 RepID=A0A1J4JSH2_9EUKA|nr:hypothetical protein TRFO_32841 [Tritrichomonas foetus]|eukprot:OHT00476.1 hypothetical protein TRFO_32841 [Tritrichomonas foetus]